MPPLRGVRFGRPGTSQLVRRSVFWVTSAIAGCPEPAGPRVTEEERGEQAHRRAEKGTTCWLARETNCERSSAYAYDKDIEAEIREVFAKTRALPRSSLWVTVQGRVVYVEGCVVANSEAAAIERLIRPLPHVQQVVAIVATPPFSKPSYKVYEAR